MPDALIFLNASQIVTCAGPGRARRGQEMRDLGILANAAVVVQGGRIEAVGPREELERRYASHTPVDCRGRVLMPGLVDSHTHAIFGRPRAEEQEMRAAGLDYMEIAKQGGGIHSSVRDLRSRTEDELIALAVPRLQRLASHGTTTVEVKSGYGLTLEDELKTLHVIRKVASIVHLRLVSTFLGAHEIPLEARATPDGRTNYISLLVHEMIPRVAEQELARFADVFCEPGAYTVAETRTILSAAQRAGLRVKLHADELRPSGGAELAVELGATSADHLGAITDDGIMALAASDTVATLLPGTLLFLGKDRQAPARTLIDRGAAVALATDFNPGTSPTPNFPFILTLAVSQLKMSVSEAVLGATVNGAAALGMAAETGQLAPGYRADLALFDIDDVRELPYWYADHRCLATWVDGQPAAGRVS
jgi:imidazolonepropionase